MREKKEGQLFKIKKYYKGIIGAIILCFFNVIAFGATNETIKIGLESVYKDASRIHLSSQGNILVGYMKGIYFQEEGTLGVNNISITKSSGFYYVASDTYATLSEAQTAAALYGMDVVPGYIAPYTYSIYSTKPIEGFFEASTSSTRIDIYNTYNELIFVSENKEQPVLFQGIESQYQFGLTKVGSSTQYRGAIGVVNGQNSGLTAFNLVDMEEYLYGVVPSEMPASWPIEALKAQAVSARSMATVQYNRYTSRGYNLLDTTASQVYKGFTAEKESTNLAVDETRGKIARYNNQVAETLYFSTSGGVTEDAKYVWGNEVPYLKSVKDLYETEPAQKSWMRTITLEEIGRCLATQNISIGTPIGVQIVSRTPGGRVQELKILGTQGDHTVKNESVRTFFSGTNEGSLKSRLFSFQAFENLLVGGTDPIEPTKVYLISKNNLLQKDLNGMVLISADDLVSVPEEVVVQGKNSTQTFKKNSHSSTVSSTNNLLQTETILGELNVYGQGYGHGVGLSQSGAKGMAKAGYTYNEILSYYFQGITIGE